MIQIESLSPNIFVSEIEKSIEFYKQLGFSLIMTVPNEKPYHWAMLKCNETTIMFHAWNSLGDELPQVQKNKAHGLLFYFKIKGILQLFEKFEKSEHVIKGLEKTFYGETEFSMLDPDGYVLTFAEELE